MAHDEHPGADAPDAGIRVSRRIADELRRCRLVRGLSVEDVAKTLRIRADFIAAMEQDRFDDLPGPAYISGFLRTYANYLGLDGGQLVTWFKDDSQSTFATTKMELPVPIAEIRRPTFPIITASLVVSIAIVATWYFYQESISIHIDLIPEVPAPVAERIAPDFVPDGVTGGDDMVADVDRASDGVSGTGHRGDEVADTADAQAGSATTQLTVTEVSPPSAGAIPEPGEDVAGDRPPSAATDAPVPVGPGNGAGSGHEQAPALAEVAGVTVPAVQADAASDVVDATGTANAGEQWSGETALASVDRLAETVAADIGADGQSTAYGTPGDGSRIELRAVAETWVQIMAPEDVTVLTHILLPGDVYHVPDRDDLMLDTGNAGGLEIRVDGRPIPSLGGAGAVVRDVRLSVDSLTRR